MSSRFLFVLLLLVPAEESLGDLRRRFDAARADGLSAADVASISRNAFLLAESAGERSRFWNTIGLIAELCEQAPHELAHQARASALELLVERYTDTNRWSALLTQRFAPPLERIPRTAWAAELAAYDGVLDGLREATTNARIASELLLAKTALRVEINRRWDWLSDADRERAIASIDGIKDDRAENYRYELRELYFGAPAPEVVGVDLEGKPFDVAGLKGKIVVLDFWTSFCQPCLAMVPDVRDLLDDLVGEPVAYVGVNGDADREQGLRTARRLEMGWSNLWDGPEGPAGPNASAWNVGELGWPAIFVIDPRGRIRAKHWGEHGTVERLRSTLRALLEEEISRP